MNEKLTKAQIIAALTPLKWKEKPEFDEWFATFKLSGIGRSEIGCLRILEDDGFYYINVHLGPPFIEFDFKSKYFDQAKLFAEQWYQNFVLGFMDFKED